MQRVLVPNTKKGSINRKSVSLLGEILNKSDFQKKGRNLYFFNTDEAASMTFFSKKGIESTKSSGIKKNISIRGLYDERIA